MSGKVIRFPGPDAEEARELVEDMEFLSERLAALYDGAGTTVVREAKRLSAVAAQIDDLAQRGAR